MVAIQIEKCDKVTSLHPNMLLGKIVSLGEQSHTIPTMAMSIIYFHNYLT